MNYAPSAPVERNSAPPYPYIRAIKTVSALQPAPPSTTEHVHDPTCSLPSKTPSTRTTAYRRASTSHRPPTPSRDLSSPPPKAQLIRELSRPNSLKSYQPGRFLGNYSLHAHRFGVAPLTGLRSSAARTDHHLPCLPKAPLHEHASSWPTPRPASTRFPPRRASSSVPTPCRVIPSSLAMSPSPVLPLKMSSKPPTPSCPCLRPNQDDAATKPHPRINTPPTR